MKAFYLLQMRCPGDRKNRPCVARGYAGGARSNAVVPRDATNLNFRKGRLYMTNTKRIHFFKAYSRLGIMNVPWGGSEMNLGVEYGSDAILSDEFLSLFSLLFMMSCFY